MMSNAATSTPLKRLGRASRIGYVSGWPSWSGIRFTPGLSPVYRGGC